VPRVEATLLGLLVLAVTVTNHLRRG